VDDDTPDALEAASARWPVALVVRFRDDASAQAITDFLETLQLEELPGEARLTTDLDARSSSVAFAPWTRRADRNRWHQRLSADRLVDEVRAVDAE
jgi:hypothetical protein